MAFSNPLAGEAEPTRPSTSPTLKNHTRSESAKKHRELLFNDQNARLGYGKPVPKASPIKNPLAASYDKNKNGFIEPAECEQYKADAAARKRPPLFLFPWNG